MVDTMLIDLKALMVEREDCDAGTVEKLKNGLAQGKTQYRTLREATEQLKKKVEASSGAQAKRWHLKLGISTYFLGYLSEAIENLKQAEGALAGFYLGKALLERQDLDEAMKAFDRAEKSGYTPARFSCKKPVSIGYKMTWATRVRCSPSWKTRRATMPSTISSSAAST